MTEEEWKRSKPLNRPIVVELENETLSTAQKLTEAIRGEIESYKNLGIVIYPDEIEKWEDYVSIREQFCKEYYDKNKKYLPKEQKGIDIIYYYKEYALWLEAKIKELEKQED